MPTAMVPVGRLQVATPASMALAVRNPTDAQRAVDERIVPVAAQVIADHPELIDAAAQRALEDAGLVRSAESTAVTDWAGAIGPEGFETKTWLQYNRFGEPTSAALKLLWNVLGPMVRASQPVLVVGMVEPALSAEHVTWWIETDAAGGFVALHEGRA